MKKGEEMKTKQRARSTRQKARLQRLREHHNKCLSKHMEYVKHQTKPSGSPNEEGDTSSLSELPSELLTASKTLPSGSPNEEGDTSSLSELSSGLFAPYNSLEISPDSERNTETCSHGSSHSGVGDDPDVPPLRRTDSIFLTKEDLESISKVSNGSEASMSCVESSGDEYIPSKASTHGSSSEGSYDLTSKVPLVKLKKQKTSQRTYRRKTLPSTSADKDNRRAESENSKTKPNLGNVSVMKLQKKKGGARVYSKKHYCLYCPMHFHKMARHLIHKHSNETAVAKAISFPLNSKERKLHFDLIRNKGNRAHNNEVLKAGSGTLIPSQQTGKPVEASDYMHCINCEALLKRKSLWRHMSRCRLSRKCSTTKPGKSRIQSLCAYAQPVPDGVSRKVWELVNAMHQDEVTNIIREEKSILRLGEHLYAKHGHDKNKHEYIRQKMREIGRLIRHSRKAGRLKQIEDFYVPSNFNFVVEAVKDVAGFDEDKNIYKTPSLALKLGHSLKKIADILECEAQMAESDNEEFLKNLERSRGLYEKKWDVCVSSRALQTLRESKWNSPQLLPFTEDVKNMHMHIDKCRQEYQSRLQNDPNKKNWSKLASLTLCELILFNRRREGEVSKMPLSAFTLRDTSGVHSDLALGLSELEQKLCQHFQRIEIRGKRNRKVPILLTPDMLSSMELLVSHRRACGVPDENPFFFSRPEAETHLRGSDAIRQIARECGAKHPETLSSTKLRKHVATLSTVLNLKDNEMDILANFLGHDIQVHRQYYRLPEGTLELAKVSKVLIALEQGRLSDFKGMSLDQIQIDPSEEVPEESDLSDTEADSSFCSLSSGSSRSKRGQTTTDEFGDDIGAIASSSPIIKRRKETESDSDDPKTGPQRPNPGQQTPDEPGSVEPATTGSSRSKERQQPDNRDPKTETSKRRSWSLAEVHAVEKTLMAFIESGKVPGKTECVTCIKASPAALKKRSWTAVKFYVKNRITAIQRESARRIY
ncbi:uncharacterized protein LOC131978403 isoform X2 [Centropristis striata]|uniref:uncharacterized protein LOC131978403 isoform X2 n=1 Tax=Centropristis striata TaxID=184440 RepID=UPI0027DF3549|nr:uncharacterized protein LOC131978403 isoform X2 [Centropristis striata]